MTDTAAEQLRILLADRATTWWRHHVPLATTMRVDQPDMAVLARQLVAAFPTVQHEYLGDALTGDPVHPQRWRRRLIAYTGLLPAPGPPPWPRAPI